MPPKTLTLHSVFTIPFGQELNRSPTCVMYSGISTCRWPPVLMRVEDNGVRLDEAALRAQSAELQSRIQEIEDEIYQRSGCTFNLSSPKQIREVLFDHLGLTASRKTSSGADVNFRIRA